MENISEEYKHYWETNMFLHTQELDSSWRLEEAFSGYYDSSSPDGAQSTAASKNIASERNRRKKLNDRLLTLRAAVPIITKMDKASIIKDAIKYIQELQEQERTIEAEILQLENNSPNFEQEETTAASSDPKKKRLDPTYYSEGSRTSPIFEDLELRLSCVGEKTLVVSISCCKGTDAMVKLCELFQSLNLKIITTNITAFSEKILKTVFIQANEEEKERLKIKIETAIAALNDPDSPMSV